MKTLTLIARRWFQKSMGNTYHTVDVIVDGVKVYTSPKAYGYSAAYEHTASEWLEKEGLLTCKRYRNGGVQPLWQACEDAGVVFSSTAVDVAREKDL